MLRDLVRYWRRDFDWFAVQERLNRLAHLRGPIDGEELVHGLRNLLRRLAHNEVERAAPVTPPDWWFFDTTHWMLQTPHGPTVKLSAAGL